MPVLIDPSVGGVTQDLEHGTPLPLSEEQLSQVVMTKYISNNPIHADWQPEGEWIEEFTSDIGRKRRPAMVIRDEGGTERPVAIDDGLIIRLKGTLAGLVGILPNMPPMSEAQVDAYQAATESPVPMFQQWDFRIERILKTNGPKAREALGRSEDHKRQAAQTEMFEAFAKMFKLGQAAMNEGGEHAPSAEKALLAGAAKMAAKEAK